MAWALVQLKLRLLVNGLRTSALRSVGFAFGALYAVGIGALALVALVALRGSPMDLDVVAVVGCVVLALGWATVPLLGFGSDETLDATRLALLPLERHELMAGLLGASMVGPAPAGTAIALAGAAIAFAPPSPGAAVVVAAAATELAMCVALSRATVTALSSALRSRKGRDLRIVLVALLAFLPQVLRLLVLDHLRGGGVSSLRPWANASSWLPPALPVRAMAAARDGHWVASLIELGAALVCVAALLAWWSRSLERVMTTAETPAGPTGRATIEPLRSRHGRVALPLFDPGLDMLPRSRAGAVACRELRYTWREPRRRVQLVSAIILPFVMLAGVVSSGGLHDHRVVFAALFVAFLAGNSRAVNQLGVDGPAFWAHEAAGQDLVADLGGKNLAVAATIVPVATVTAIGLAVVSGGWVELAMTLPLSLAIVAALLGVGNVASVLVPVPLPDTGANLWGSQGGQGWVTALLTFAVLAVELVLAAPVAIAALLVHGAPGRTLVVLAALACGGALRQAGLAIAVRAGRDRGPELLEALSPRRAA